MRRKERIMRSICCLALCLCILMTLPAAVWGEEAEETAEIETIVTIIPAPDQTQAERPPCFPDPAEGYIPLPETENFALNRPVQTANHADVYVEKNVNDGKTDTYWESKGVPAEMIILLEETRTVSTVTVCLNPSAVWEPRTQEIAVALSLDGETWTNAAEPVKYDFNAETGNRIRIDFEPMDAGFVKVIFTMNSSSRSMGAQAAEIGVY